MISYEEALKKVLENVHALRPEKRPVLESTGQVVAQDILSDLDLPQADNAGGSRANLTSIAMANALTILPEESAVRAGDAVRASPLDWGRYQFGTRT